LETILTIFPNEIVIFESIFKKFVQMVLIDKEEQLIITSYISLLSRIMFNDIKYFFTFFDDFEGFLIFIEKSLEKSDLIVSSTKKKYLAISLLSLFPSDNINILKKFGDIFNLSVECMYEDDLNLDLENFNIDKDDLKNEIERRKWIIKNDSFFGIDILNYCLKKLNEIKNVLGENNFNQLMKNIDQKIINQFYDIQKIKLNN
jgi:hypothetical protein